MLLLWRVAGRKARKPVTRITITCHVGEERRDLTYPATTVGREDRMSNRDAEIRCECGAKICQTPSWREGLGVYWITPEYCDSCQERQDQEKKEILNGTDTV